MVKRKVLHLCASGNTGGIERLLRNYCEHSNHQNYFCFVWSGGSVAEEMESIGANVIYLDYSANGPVKTLRQILRICKEYDIDVAVAHHSSAFLQLLLIYIKWFCNKIMTVGYIHSNIEDKNCVANREKSWLKREIEKVYLHTVDGIVAISESVKQSVCHYAHIPEKKVQVVYNGTPLMSSKQNKLLSDKIRIIYVGRLISDKGVQQTLDALALLDEQYNFEFSIAGDGPFRKDLECKVDKLGLSKKVKFLGNCENVAELLWNSDFFIHMPVWEEGFGITVVEAMSAGCVCICAAKGGIPEIICDGKNGYLIYSDRPQELAETLEKLIPMYTDGQCQAIKQNAVLRADFFSIHNYSKNLDSYLGRDVKN